ncbi:MAG: molybdopterin-synthase adenylyltransferase MoeB [Chloroflexi bacterium]|nr:molybdopterin-synthase adenylyltransferase MoeB [Chloroflexota bacterium]
MPISVYIPTPWRRLTQGLGTVEANAGDIAGLLDALEASYPGLKDHICNEKGEIPRHISVFVNREEIDALQGLRTPVRDGDEVAFIPAIAGGAVTLSQEQIVRYSRHILLPEVGGRGQKKLLAAKVLIIGAGGLGSPAALYLAAAGVGTLGIVDGDVVDLSNLQRQILHHVDDIGRPKTESAAEAIMAINPDVQVVPHQVILSSENALEILSGYDIIVNGCDNFPTRYLVNDACVLLHKPLVDGSIFRFDGQVAVFLPGRGCYRCLFPAPPPPGTVPSCAEAGVLGVLPGLVGVIQAVEAIKLVLGIGKSLAGRLVLVDTLPMEFHQVNLRRDPTCPVCGDHPTITHLIDYYEFCGVPGPGH